MRPIPITERLPDTPHGCGNGKQSAPVLAYGTGEYPGWSAAVYVVREDGETFWEYAAEGVGGYEWEVARLEAVSHWMPYPPSPDAAVWRTLRGG